MTFWHHDISSRGANIYLLKEHTFFFLVFQFIYASRVFPHELFLYGYVQYSCISYSVSRGRNFVAWPIAPGSRAAAVWPTPGSCVLGLYSTGLTHGLGGGDVQLIYDDGSLLVRRRRVFVMRLLGCDADGKTGSTTWHLRSFRKLHVSVDDLIESGYD